MKSLYLGLTPPHQDVIHYPVIRIEPMPIEQNALDQFADTTHLIFTSKTAVTLFSKLCHPASCHQKIIAVGEATKQTACAAGFPTPVVAHSETAEGVVESLSKEDLTNAHVVWPHSAKARPVISNFLQEQGVKLTELVLYDTHLICPTPIPSLQDIDRVFFTSPSTVDGFLNIFGNIPAHVEVVCQGPVTAAYLAAKMD